MCGFRVTSEDRCQHNHGTWVFVWYYFVECSESSILWARSLCMDYWSILVETEVCDVQDILCEFKLCSCVVYVKPIVVAIEIHWLVREHSDFVETHTRDIQLEDIHNKSYNNRTNVCKVIRDLQRGSSHIDNTYQPECTEKMILFLLTQHKHIFKNLANYLFCFFLLCRWSSASRTSIFSSFLQLELGNTTYSYWNQVMAAITLICSRWK